MDLRTRKEYTAVVKERYWKARSKNEKSLILNEYCANTGQARKYPRLPAAEAGVTAS